MDIFIRRLALVRADLGQPLADVGALCGAQDPGGGQPLRVEQRPSHVGRKERRVLGLDAPPDLGRELRHDAAPPERHSAWPSRRSYPCRSCIARVSVMSLICTASWPMRSPAVNAVAL